MLRIACLGVALVSLAVANAAHAASPFAPPATLSPPGSTMGELRMNASGDVVIVWQGPSGAGTASERIEAVTGRRGSPLSAVQRLASGGVRDPRVALDGDGRMAAVWKSAYPALGLVTGSVQTGFGPVETFRPPGAMTIAVGPLGQAVAVWAEGPPGTQTHTRLLASYRPAAGAFGGAVLLAEHGDLDPRPAVAIDAAGAIVVAWRAGADRRGPHRAWVSRIPPGGRPGVPVALSSPGEDVRTTPRLATGERGDVAVSWYAGSPAPGSRVAVRPGDGAFGPPEAVAGGPGSLSVAFDRDGAALAVWSATVRTGQRATRVLRVRGRPPGGPFGPTEEIAVPRLFRGSYRAGLDGRGNAIVAWGEEREGRARQPVLLAAVQRPGGRFGLPTTLAERATPQALGFDAAGLGMLVARAWRTGVLLSIDYLSPLLDVAAAPALAGLDVDLRGRRARFLITEPGKVVARVYRVRGKRHRRVGGRTVAVRRGTRALSLRDGRGRRLRPGTYRLTLRAHDLTGRRLARRSLRFRVARG